MMAYEGVTILTNLKVPPILRVPNHVKAFSCNQCGACCTNKWNIEIDDLSFDTMFEPFKKLGRQQEFYQAMLFRHKGQRIRFLANGKCPFLSDNSLCNIQLEFGSEFMADICKIYPRRIFASPRGLEFSLSLTCLTAVGTLAQQQIFIEEIDSSPHLQRKDDFYFIPPKTFEEYSPIAVPQDDFRRQYYHLEDIFISLLQNREYSLTQRLIVLGQVVASLTNPFYSDRTEYLNHTIEEALDGNRRFIMEPNTKKHFEQLCFTINKYLTRNISRNGPPLPPGITPTRISNTSYPFRKSLEMVRSKIMTLSHEEYKKKLDEYFITENHAIDVVLENYLVNFVLSKHFFFELSHLAYYKMAFSYAASISFALGYCIMNDQPINQDFMLQAICDVENIFYQEWFYRQAMTLQSDYGDAWVMKNSIALVHI